MEIKIYVDFEERTVCTEEEYEEYREAKILDHVNDTDCFYQWLNENFLPESLWDIDAEEVRRIKKRWKDEVRENYEEVEDIEEFTINV